MVQMLWEVVGGAGAGGILVRCGQELTSGQHTERLSTGALVEAWLDKWEKYGNGYTDILNTQLFFDTLNLNNILNL